MADEKRDDGAIVADLEAGKIVPAGRCAESEARCEEPERSKCAHVGHWWACAMPGWVHGRHPRGTWFEQWYSARFAGEPRCAEGRMRGW